MDKELALNAVLLALGEVTAAQIVPCHTERGRGGVFSVSLNGRVCAAGYQGD